QLWLWGFVDRIELPVAPSLGGRRPYLYTLGRRGVPVVASLMERGSRAVNRRRLDRLNDLEIEHDLKAALFWAMLRGYLETTWIERWSWVAERDLRALHRRVYDREADRARPVLPDGEFWLHYPSGRVQWGMVEIDAGTLTLSRFRDKVRALSLWAESYLEKQPEGATRPDIGVYVVSLSEGRMAKLMEQAAKAVDSLDSWPPFYFATFDDLQPDAFPACWRQFDAKSYYLLYADAFEQPQKGA
ncbi:MAG TPA: replication-relaxation family protein, partial [Chloroflexota bacterium]|nr:replication-relaxation family protein [Chloroflexota bacterium]